MLIGQDMLISNMPAGVMTLLNSYSIMPYCCKGLPAAALAVYVRLAPSLFDSWITVQPNRWGFQASCLATTFSVFQDD